MKSRLLSHPGLKAASLIVAFAVWLIIMNISNPVIRKTITNVPVNVTNASYVESMNLSYALAPGNDTVSVMVEANRSIVERLNAGKITATADLTQIIDMDSNPVMVPVVVNVPGVNPNAVVVTPGNIEINLEEMESKEFVINAVSGSSTPARGYEVGTMTCIPERVTIRGPKSMIQRLDKVLAEVDVSYLSEDADLIATLHVVDRNGDELTESRMKYLTFSASEVVVHVTLFRVWPDIGISAETYGEPSPGYYVGEISVTPETISIAGSDEALAEFKAAGKRITITSESRAVDISGASGDVEIRVNITDYLPAGIRLASGFSDTVLVSVKILEFNTKSIEIDTKNIVKANLGDNLNAVFDNPTVDIRVKGSDAALSALSAEMISAEVDLSGISAGTFMLPVTVELPAGISLAEEPQAEITITETTVMQQPDSVPAA